MKKKSSKKKTKMKKEMKAMKRKKTKKNLDKQGLENQIKKKNMIMMTMIISPQKMFYSQHILKTCLDLLPKEKE